ncbi:MULTISPECIES: M20 aminoacylase family protein [Ralstonia solanacearum species complex]|uniref:M20 aminoacylase family protein n=1 Tax=Ralstonia solanacearum species complex TaxID=3116862 RepID=UPI000E57FDFE|nr:M20 aminoacylase family protein [Ralstonia solanacearum]BEU73855.1 M20 aminoacylase family protein [Ralstonia pseudosolanacearum]AXV78784.1 amidohydrolase [Ralstonia solanacearum]AXV92806.1 amidohydrolase [Ralstonia solanacearum]AXW20876.1 amidohydrolase [Ralstonia solanacearum]AXW77703.1 amidohydrolase [Ralstonia solanacearum]
MTDPGEHAHVADQAHDHEELVAIRRHIHRHPELSFEEADTAALVADKLEAWGYQVTRHVGGHGVVGTLKAGTGTRSIGIRADMDALPIHEQTGLPYASVHDGKMHACGHDGHTTVLLGAARELARTRRFDGAVHLIFQPAEEAGADSGAERMIADGLFERFPCDAVFGLHNHPGAPTGTFLFRSGPFMAACDTVKITIHGKGGHAARPHLAVDPIVMASSLVMALQTIVSRNIDPTETAVVTVGSMHAGHVANVIPERATLELSVRSFNDEVRRTLEARIRALADSQVAAYGGRAEVEVVRGYPVLVNSDAETELARQVAVELVGEAHVVAPFPAIAGSEDFAYFLQQRPGCFLRIGNGVGAPMLHNAHYDFADDNLTIGATYWTRLVERYLAANRP